MAAPSGLSRRRVGAVSAEDPNSYTSPTPSSSNPASPHREAPGARSPLSASTSLDASRGPEASSHRIAYDPNELENGEDSLYPKLSLMEEALLLGLKDKQGYLSFWNDNISYTLRGCILVELAFRHRIAIVKDPHRRRFPLPDRLIEVVDDRHTGEVLLDEALKLMKVSERMSIGTWIDLMSGETWNVMKIGYQLKQVRERLLKGLVDKGVLRTEKRNFLLFDMATHPVTDAEYKTIVVNRVRNLVASSTTSIQESALYEPSIRYRTLRAICLVCAAFAGNVLENALMTVPYEARENAFSKCDSLLAQFGQWPFGGDAANPNSGPSNMSSSRSQRKINLAGGSSEPSNNLISELTRLVNNEIEQGKDPFMEIIAGVLQVFAKMDSLL